ncbi:hypothetical protein DXB51_14605 [Bacillus cereus]|uniref:Uncharacterized protein n=1 Tax=Bacillus luti TaxID=2026191 RepID=A0ABU8HXI8_9BACI|nr:MULTISPECIES: hypothetical protein [Bacillus]RGN77221.1 hypothetical protein DXB51_14605 [Bacillus cereus]TSI21513.1 hypothetical protein FOT98_02785 [Bacillus sp. HY001]
MLQLILLLLQSLFKKNSVPDKKKTEISTYEIKIPPKKRFTLRIKNENNWWYIYDEKLQNYVKAIVYDEDRKNLSYFNQYISWEDESRFNALCLPGRDFKYFSVIDLKTNDNISGFSSIEEAKNFARVLNDIHGDKKLLEIAKRSVSEFDNRTRYIVKGNENSKTYEIYDSKTRTYLRRILNNSFKTFDEAKIIAHLFNLIVVKKCDL